MYFSDTGHLGYRFRGFADKFIDIYSGFAKSGAVYEKRFPELYEYLDMYAKWFENRKKEGYRINGLECFMRSAVSNRMDNNIVLGVPHAVEYGMPPHTALGVDCDGNEVEFHAVNTNTFLGNYDNTSKGYDKLSDMIDEY